jgi:hypothetical protein
MQAGSWTCFAKTCKNRASVVISGQVTALRVVDAQKACGRGERESARRLSRPTPGSNLLQVSVSVFGVFVVSVCLAGVALQVALGLGVALGYPRVE